MRTIRFAWMCVLGLIVFAPGSNLSAAGPDPVRLWADGAPGSVGNEPADHPDVRVYLPKENANGAAVVILPGGGYTVLAMDHEGHQVAKWFNTIGVAAFVVKYRLGPRYHHPAPLQDAQRAIRFVRANADKFGVSARRVGIMGFSAGGHLASTAATHFDSGKSDSADPIARQSSRPDFAVLCYPVVSLTETFSHPGSARNLLGEKPEQVLLELLSNEKHVTPETPPTFLFHTGDDTGVPVENTLVFYSALRRNKVPAELHVYQVGPHGVGLANADPATYAWKDRLGDWLRANSFLSDSARGAVSGKVRLGEKPLRWGMIAFVPKKAHEPRAWAMVANGQFNLAENRGPSVGENQVVVYNLGSVEPQPTLEDVQVFEHETKATIQAGKNEVNVDLKEARETVVSTPAGSSGR